MVSGTLYSYPGSHRAYQILIAAGYSGADVKVDPNFEFGKTNASPDFLKKFPLGKAPAFEDSNGNCLSETNAIAGYVANEQLLGGASAINQALVQQYISFADNEITPSACTWTFPTLGFRQYNKQDTEKSMNHIKSCLSLLNNLLDTRTFLVGERVTLADISVSCSLIVLYAQVLDPKFRQPYGNVNRWFTTCVNQPIFKKIIGDVTMCTKMATFNAAKYNDLHPKDNKKATKDAKSPKPKKEEPQVVVPAAPKEKKDPFADVPKSTFVLDDWKKMYANNETDVSYPYLWENFDPNAYSIWFFKYKHPEELTKSFLACNMIGGFLQRVEGLRKHSHVIAGIYENNEPSLHYDIQGCWLFKGTSLIFERSPDWNVDAPEFTFTKLDPINNKDDRLCFEYSFLFEGEWSKGRGEPCEYKEMR